jgi:hypothetical protein
MKNQEKSAPKVYCNRQANTFLQKGAGIACNVDHVNNILVYGNFKSSKKVEPSFNTHEGLSNHTPFRPI